MDYIYVKLMLHEDVWNSFRNATKLKRGDLSREFTKALTIYLGVKENTLAMWRYWKGVSTYTEIINPRFEMFDDDYEFILKSRIQPLNERLGFSEELIKTLVEQCLRRGRIVACIDDYRLKPVEIPGDIDEIVQKIKDRHSMIFEVEVDGKRIYPRVSSSEVSFTGEDVVNNPPLKRRAFHGRGRMLAPG